VFRMCGVHLDQARNNRRRRQGLRDRRDRRSCRAVSNGLPTRLKEEVLRCRGQPGMLIRTRGLARISGVQGSEVAGGRNRAASSPRLRLRPQG
jgi:hypothetical protein